MKFLIDMNLSPQWVSVFKDAGWKAQHYSNLTIKDYPCQEYCPEMILTTLKTTHID